MVSLSLPEDLRSAKVARRVVADMLSELPASSRDTAVLLVDELVSNALVHTNGGLRLRVTVVGQVVRVDVFDRAQREPVMQREMSPGQEHGRGLRIVDSLASEWGVDQMPHGKRVWFRIDPGLRKDESG
jgi:anti-sigma regulatory factor (Ser/Thr protein kinase)